MAIIPQVFVSDKAGSAEVVPPIDCNWDRQDQYNVEDCVYILESTKGGSDPDPSSFYIGWAAGAMAKLYDRLPQLDTAQARQSAEELFSKYGRTLIWQS